MFLFTDIFNKQILSTRIIQTCILLFHSEYKPRDQLPTEIPKYKRLYGTLWGKLKCCEDIWEELLAMSPKLMDHSI